MKTITEKILDGIKQTLQSGEKVTIDLREQASLTGSGDGQGGKTYFDNAFAALRYANPFRRNARTIKVAGSSAMFVAKTVMQPMACLGVTRSILTSEHPAPILRSGNCPLA